MGKVSLKALICAVFYAIVAMAMGGCIMEPVKLVGFGDDETFDKGVQIREGSDAGLVDGNARITGLIPGKYYMVEEWSGSGTAMGIQFVSSSGRRSAYLTGIGRVSTGELSELTNFHHYMVKSAQPLTGNVSYYYLSAGSASSQTQTPVNGEITISPLPPGSGNYLIFTTTLPTASISNYDIASVPVSPADSAKNEPTMNPLMLMMQAFPGAMTDYVFYDRVNKALYVLRVVFGEKDDEEGLNINVTFSVGDESPKLEWSNDNSTWTNVPTKPTPLNVLISPSTPIYIRVKDFSNYANISWYCNGNTAFATGNSFLLTPGTIPFDSPKTYDLTVVGTFNADGKPYGTSVFIRVDN